MFQLIFNLVIIPPTVTIALAAIDYEVKSLAFDLL